MLQLFESVRLTESKMCDDLWLIMAGAGKKDTEEDRDKGEWRGQVKGRGSDNQTSGKVEGRNNRVGCS